MDKDFRQVLDNSRAKTISTIGAVTAATVALYLSSHYSYLLFHSLIEIATVAVAFTLFILTWNTHSYSENNYLRLLGIGYAFIALIDLVHTLAFKGMNVFPGYGTSNLPAQLWIAARYLQAATLVLAPLFVTRRLDDRVVIAGFTVAVAALATAVFSRHFPDCFIDGRGLTPFKISSEYFISAALLVSLYLLYGKRRFFNNRVFYLTVCSIACTILSELAFTSFASLYSFTNMLGHFLKLGAFYLIYRAILVTGLKEPFHLIFRDLKQTEAALLAARDTLEERVRERTEELHIQTLDLEEEMAKRQTAQENLQIQTALLEKEVEERRKAQDAVEKLNERLEQRVQERTYELKERNDEVLRAYDDLKRLQGQLLQHDKMASIGQLAAGIAHEINTPTQFLSDNMAFLRDALKEVLAFLATLRDECDEDPASPQTPLTARIQALDLDYLLAEIPQAIQQSQDGLVRVARIVSAMKAFSHPGAEGKSPADLNTAIESTITVAHNEWKYVATLETALEPGLPLVPCFLGEFNQVILNLLVNSAHAIRAAQANQATEALGQIRIGTARAGDGVEIRISDTGAGIPESIRSRIFEPFFTTKEVGKGTGLGLSIAYDIIVHKHGGTIRVDSEVGKGTTFILTLPLPAA